MSHDELDHHLVHAHPVPLYMGELPHRWAHVPARVVVNLCGSFPMGEPYERVVLSLALLDVQEPEFLPSRAVFERFLDAVSALAEHEPSYWHCHAGINRSGLAVAAYLHRHRGIRISEAIASLRSKRHPMVLCNSLFEQRLREWYGEPDEQVFSPVSVDTWTRERSGSRDDS